MSNTKVARKSTSRVKSNIKLGKYTCQSRCKAAVVAYLPENQIDFKWQIPFKLSNGGTYVCDILLIETGTYVEIKGRWRQRSLEKWKEFCSKESNTEVWNKSKLVKMELIDSHGYISPKYPKILREKYKLQPYEREL